MFRILGPPACVLWRVDVEVFHVDRLPSQRKWSANRFDYLATLLCNVVFHSTQDFWKLRS
jgi:hypothetical protein